MSNVKPGQLAMFKPGSGPNAGRLVSVIKRADYERMLSSMFVGVGDVWWSVRAMQRLERYEGATKKTDFMPGESLYCPDSVLMPLHDGDGEDEILRRVGKPQQRDTTLTPRKQLEHVR